MTGRQAMLTARTIDSQGVNSPPLRPRRSPALTTVLPMLRGSCVPGLGWRREDTQIGHHLGAKLSHHVLAQLRFGACGNTGCAEALAERGPRVVAIGRHDADRARRRVTR